MKFKLFAVTLYVATASFEIFEATEMSLLQHFMKNEFPPRERPAGEQNFEDNVCPREIKISWQLQAPFTLENYSKDKPQTQVNGILHQALEFALEKCCAFYKGNKTTMRYLARYDNSSGLQRTVLSFSTRLVHRQRPTVHQHI